MSRKYDKNIFNPKYFHLEFLTKAQNEAYELYKKNDILFLVGPAGVGKTHLALAFAIRDVLEKTKNKIILSRPVVAAGEDLGFLPGDLDDKVYPYMLPLYDCLDKICGVDGENREYIDKKYELAPLGFLRGRTFENCICILDEAQNCTKGQLKLFLTRLGNNSKMIVTGDPSQSDLIGKTSSGLIDVMEKIQCIEGVGVISFNEETIVRHPLVSKIVKLI